MTLNKLRFYVYTVLSIIFIIVFFLGLCLLNTIFSISNEITVSDYHSLIQSGSLNKPKICAKNCKD